MQGSAVILNFSERRPITRILIVLPNRHMTNDMLLLKVSNFIVSHIQQLL